MNDVTTSATGGGHITNALLRYRSQRRRDGGLTRASINKRRRHAKKWGKG